MRSLECKHQPSLVQKYNMCRNASITIYYGKCKRKGKGTL